MTQQQKPTLSLSGITASPSAKLATEKVLNDTGPESVAPTDVRKSAAAEIAQAMKNAFGASVKPAEGVTLMTLTEPPVQAAAVAAAAHSVLFDQTLADMPVHAVSEITFLHSSGSREAEAVTSCLRTVNQTDKVRSAAIEHCQRFNPLAPEGVPIVMSYVKTKACIFTMVTYGDLKRDDAIAAITRLNAEAQKVHALIVMLVVHTKKQDITELRKCCNANVEISSCEPGPGAHIAVLLDNVTLTSWHQQGIGRVMVEARLESDGTWSFATERFIAKRAIIRLAWYVLSRANARKEDMPLAKLAQVVGIDPSNISRGIAQLLISPKNAVGVAPPKGWCKRWAADYCLEVMWPRKSTDENAIAPAVAVLGGTGQTVEGVPVRNRDSLNDPQ